MTDQRKNKLKRILLESRYRLLCRNEAFALPLKEMTFVAVDDVYRISTNGESIFFDASWLVKLEKACIDFILSHQLMHIHMKHINRPEYFKGDRFHLACDIVANARLRDLWWYFDKLPSVGTIYTQTFFPAEDGYLLTAQEAIRGIPFDPAVMKPAERRRYRIDSEDYWDRSGCEEWGTVVLSPTDPDPDDLHFEYTFGGLPYNVKAEEYDIPEIDNSINTVEVKKPDYNGATWDSISSDTIKSLRYVRQRYDDVSGGRIWYKTDPTKLDWRNMLNNFVQDEVFDYSFMPPDRRYGDTDFFLPDFNVNSKRPIELFFAVDTSASVSDKMLSAVLSELSYAVSQLNGRAVCQLVFFDTRVYPAGSIGKSTDIINVMPVGGGATDIGCVFEYVHQLENPPNSIIICTDGTADFPDESQSRGIPVLWLLTSIQATPSWGKATKINI